MEMRRGGSGQEKRQKAALALDLNAHFVHHILHITLIWFSDFNLMSLSSSVQ